MDFDKRKLISIIIAVVITIIVIFILLIPDVSRSFNNALARMRMNRSVQTIIRVFAGVAVALGTFFLTFNVSKSIISKPKFSNLMQSPPVQQSIQQPMQQSPEQPMQQPMQQPHEQSIQQSPEQPMQQSPQQPPQQPMQPI